MTIKQEKALANLAENGGNVSKAMRDAGYSPVSAATPKKLTESVAFKQALDEFLPERKLLQVHKEGLDAMKVHGSMTEPDKLVPDFPTRHKYLETGYKLRGKLLPESLEGMFQGAIIVPVIINRGKDDLPASTA